MLMLSYTVALEVNEKTICGQTDINTWKLFGCSLGFMFEVKWLLFYLLDGYLK